MYKLPLILSVFIGVVSCNPYKHLGNRPPLTAADSAAILALCTRLVPIDTAGFKIPEIKTVQEDSTAYFKAIIDSLASIANNDLAIIDIQYRDTCTTAKDLYKQGFNTGYQAGEYYARQSANAFYTKKIAGADSACKAQVVKSLSELRQAYEIKLAALQNQLNLANLSKEKYRVKSENRGSLNIWMIAIAAFFIIVSILLWKFRRQQKAANNIINDVKNLRR